MPKQQLETYLWEGCNRRGEFLRGEQNAFNANVVKSELHRQGILPRKIRKKKNSFFFERVTGKDITAFTRQMATLLTAGIPLNQALDLVGRSHNKLAMQSFVSTLKNKIESGSSLTEALQQYPGYCNELYCNLVSAGERSGSLDIMFDRIASYKEKTDSLKGKIKKALFYPTAVIIVAILVTVALLIFVVPQFEFLFTGFGADLPIPTRVVIASSKFLQSYGGLILVIIVAILGLIKIKFRRSHQFVYKCDRILLKLPIIGSILVKAIIARFARTLTTTFAAGLSIVDALSAVAGATGNQVYSAATKKIQENVTTGQTLEQSLRQTNLFPNLVVQMIAIGEQSGMLEGMLSKIAGIYEEEVDNAVDSLSSLIEPFIMVFLGVLIGGLVIAMYLPIFKLGGVV